MGYVCKSCGNTNEFLQDEYGHCSYTDVNKINNEGDILEQVGDTQYDDWESSDNENERCAICESTEVEWMEEAEYEEWKKECQNPTNWKDRYQK